MATIAGSQYNATASGEPVNVGFDNSGSLPPTVPGAFNLEIFVGTDASAPALAPGYQGLAVLSPGGYELDLISGAFAVTDNGTGGETLAADGTNETIAGGAAFSNLILNGNDNTANGGSGGNFIEVNGAGDTVHAGSGGAAIDVSTSGNTIIGGGGSATITDLAGGNTIIGGSGPDTITAIGNDDAITGGSGADLVNALGAGDTVNAGAGNMTIDAVGGGLQFNDNSGAVYNDTIVGFSNAAGDHIHLSGGDTVQTTAAVNSGQDTLITLSDGSTILLKGVTSVSSSFFN